MVDEGHSDPFAYTKNYKIDHLTMEGNTVPNTDGWGTEEDSNQVP